MHKQVSTKYATACIGFQCACKRPVIAASCRRQVRQISHTYTHTPMHLFEDDDDQELKKRQKKSKRRDAAYSTVVTLYEATRHYSYHHMHTYTHTHIIANSNIYILYIYMYMYTYTAYLVTSPPLPPRFYLLFKCCLLIAMDVAIMWRMSAVAAVPTNTHKQL